jgi:predicted DNA-binding protein
MTLGKRVGFYLTDLQIKNLKNVSKKTGLTVSEIIRRAIDEHLEQYKEIVVKYREEKQIKPGDIEIKLKRR